MESFILNLNNIENLKNFLEKVNNNSYIPVNIEYTNTYIIVYSIIFIILSLFLIESFVLKRKISKEIERLIEKEDKEQTIKDSELKKVRKKIFFFYLLSNLALFVGIVTGFKAYNQYKELSFQKSINQSNKCFNAKMLYNKKTGQCYVPNTLEYLKEYKRRMYEKYSNLKEENKVIKNKISIIQEKIREYQNFIKKNSDNKDTAIKQLVMIKKETLPDLIKQEKFLQKESKNMKVIINKLRKKIDITDNYISTYEDMNLVRNFEKERKNNRKLDLFIDDGLMYIKDESKKDLIKFKAEKQAKKDLDKIKEEN